MAVNQDEFDPTDPYAMVRRRVTNQLGGTDAPPLETAGVDTSSPTPPAEFQPQDVAVPRNPPPTPVVPVAPPGTNVDAGGNIVSGQPNPNEGAPTPTTPAGTGSPTQTLDADALRIAKIFGMQGKTATAVDIAYWKSVLARAGGDWGYVTSRMLAPNTGPTLPGSYDASRGVTTSGAGAPTGGATGLSMPTLGGGGTIGNYGLQAPQGIWSPDFVATLRQLIQERLKGASQPVDPNDPNINIPVTAARDQLTRGNEAERTALAERAYATGGLNTDLIGRQIQQSNERSGTTLSGIRANLIQREIVSRRSELQDLLSMVMAAGDSDAARQIQLQIAALNAQLQEQGQAINLAEFGAQLNQNAALFGGRG